MSLLEFSPHRIGDSGNLSLIVIKTHNTRFTTSYLFARFFILDEVVHVKSVFVKIGDTHLYQKVIA